MFGNIFYHRTLRKAVSVFGSIFNDISVVRRDKTGAEVKRIKVPLAYGPKERYLARVAKEPDFNQGNTIQLPRISFQIVSMTYDGNRKLNTMHKNFVATTDQGSVKRQFNPVSYKIGIELSVMSKYIDDANQIVEQILPWFTPDFTTTIKSIPELNLIDDVPITLQSVNMTDNFEDDWMNRRDVIWTFNFEMKVLFYGPIKDSKIITKSQTDILIPAPGLAVDDPSAQAATGRVARVLVEALPGETFEDDFGFSETVLDFDDQKKYNPVTGVDEEIVLKIGASSIPSGEKFGNDKIS